MPRKRRNNRNRNNGHVSVSGFLYLLKHLGRPFLNQGPKGQPIYEFTHKGPAEASQAIWENVKDLDITSPVIDGLKIGLVRRLGLGVTIMKIGKTRIRSV